MQIFNMIIDGKVIYNFLHNEILLAERIFVSGVIIKKISQDEILTNGIEWLKEKIPGFPDISYFL